jgi:Tfp pilus assembly protein PilF
MYKNLADAYYFVGINEKCQYNYEKAIKLNPTLDEAMYNLAACIFTQGNFFNADIWISKALSIDPKNIDYQALKKEVQNRLADVQKQSQE